MMNSLLLKALKSFSATCNKTMLQANDEDRIKLTFKVLHKNRIPINPAEIEPWLVANHWPQRSWPPSSAGHWLSALAASFS